MGFHISREWEKRGEEWMRERVAEGGGGGG